MPTPRKYATEAEKHRAYRERRATARLQELQAKGLPAAPPIATMPGTARWQSLIQHGYAALDASRDEMDVYFDERSEEWQQSERGEELQERIERLTEITDMLNELLQELPKR